MTLSSTCKAIRVRQASGMAFLSIMMLMVFTAVGFAAFYVMVQPSASTARRERTQRTGEVLQRGLQALEEHRGTPVPTPSSLSYLLDDLNNDGCTMDNDSMSPTFGRLYGWCGPYVDSIWQSEPDAFMLDGWGTPFEVSTSPSTVVRSCGPDKICGGANAADDLTFSL